MTTGPARALLRRLGLFLDGFSACFSRQPQRVAATQYIDGLFNDSERKSMQAMHGRLGDPRDYQALQHFITHSPWDSELSFNTLMNPPDPNAALRTAFKHHKDLLGE